VDELGTRQHVTDAMLNATGFGDAKGSFPLVLNGKAAAMADRHATLYSKKGLLTKVDGVEGLANHLHLDAARLRQTFASYNAAAATGKDEFGRKVFPAGHWPVEPTEEFYVGFVTPVVHYTMGGLAIDSDGRVLSEKADGTQDGEPIIGLYAIGEASGGVHGYNRLAGNSLLECTVFGRHVGQSIPISNGGNSQRGVVAPSPAPVTNVPTAAPPTPPVSAPVKWRNISKAELLQHKSEQAGYWVALYGKVYDLTDYAPEHPGGFEAVADVSGDDGTETFASVHNREMLDSMGFEPIGVLEA